VKIKKLKIQPDMIPTDIIFLIGTKNHNSYIDKMKIGDQYKLNTAGKTIDMTHVKHGHRIIIGVNPKKYDVYQIKSLIVHEIAHAVDYIMARHGFEGTEFRAYLQQHLYIHIMKYYDEQNQI
jgi:predicted SprT family Zn-dependent metalloprotease